MYEVYVWVPTKGWKLLCRTRNEDKAFKVRGEFLPLETKLCFPDGASETMGDWIAHPMEAKK